MDPLKNQQNQKWLRKFPIKYPAVKTKIIKNRLDTAKNNLFFRSFIVIKYLKKEVRGQTRIKLIYIVNSKLFKK
jgi:hypothetical protein